MFQGVHNGSITDITQAYDHMGPSGDLSMAGMEKLKQELEDKNPLREQTFKAVRSMIAGKGDAFGIPDPDAEKTYGHAMQLMYQAEAEEKSKGVPPSKMYDPQSPEWIGNVAKPLVKTLDQRAAALSASISKPKIAA